MEEEIRKKKVKIIKAEDLPEDEKVYLRKDYFGWRTVEPWKDPDTNKINWFNLLLGGKRNLVFLLFITIIISALYFGVTELISNYKTIADNPCLFCNQCSDFASNKILLNLSSNLTWTN